MNILCVIDSLGSGGAQRQLINLAIGFKKYGHNVTILYYHNYLFFKDEVDKFGINLVYLPSDSYLFRLLKIRKYIRAKTNHFDAVVSFMDAPNFICEISGLPWRRWKLIVGERSANPMITKSVKLIFFKIMHLFSDYVIANSIENIKIVKQANPVIPIKKLKVIYNSVRLNTLPIDTNPNFLASDKLKLTVVASHQYLKNLNGLIEAVNILNDVDKMCLIINWFGGPRNDSSYPEAIKKIKKYKLDGIFSFHEPEKNIFSVIAHSDVIGIFSIYEGLPNVLCEAMSMSKAVISSNISDIPKIINYDSSLIFNPQNYFEIASSIKYLLSLSKDEILSIGAKNKKIADALFNWDNVTLQYLSCIVGKS